MLFFNLIVNLLFKCSFSSVTAVLDDVSEFKLSILLFFVIKEISILFIHTYSTSAAGKLVNAADIDTCISTNRTPELWC